MTLEQATEPQPEQTPETAQDAETIIATLSGRLSIARIRMTDAESTEEREAAAADVERISRELTIKAAQAQVKHGFQIDPSAIVRSSFRN